MFNKLKEIEKFKNRRAKTSRNEFRQQKSDANWYPSNRNRSDLLHHLQVHLHLRTKVSTKVRSAELSLPILKVVWHKGGVRLLHVVGRNH